MQISYIKLKYINLSILQIICGEIMNFNPSNFFNRHNIKGINVVNPQTRQVIRLINEKLKSISNYINLFFK